jgi:GT2 family glycosyltransferase
MTLTRSSAPLSAETQPVRPCLTATVVLYNHSAADVQELFESLSRETILASWSVVNNGGSAAACALAGSLGGTCLDPGGNLGFGAANNLALRSLRSPCDYHLIVNPDIRLNAGVLERLHAFMEHHPDVGLVMPKILYTDGSEQRLCKLLPTPFDLFLRRFLGSLGKSLFKSHWDAYEMRNVDLSMTREVPSLSGCFMFVRTAALAEVGAFDERYFLYMEDLDLCRRIGSRYRTVFYPAVSVCHGYAKGSYANNRLFGYHLRSAIRYFNKWGWFHDAERRRLNARIAPIGD